MNLEPEFIITFIVEPELKSLPAVIEAPYLQIHILHKEAFPQMFFEFFELNADLAEVFQISNDPTKRCSKINETRQFDYHLLLKRNMSKISTFSVSLYNNN